MQNEKYLEEYVMVFPTALLDEIGKFQGLTFELNKYLKVILDPTKHSFIQRKNAESNPDYKQLIPYSILHSKGKIFVYCRGKLLAEKRLHGNYSIGVGGHISITDPTLFSTTYEDGLIREVNEEVNIESKYQKRIAALLNDDSNDVGKVHFGIIHIFDLDEPLVKPREKSIKETRFSTFEELKKDVDKFETWSQICIKQLDKLISNM